jgi:hypothetical protein
MKKSPFKHKVEAIPAEEILANRSNAYEFIDFDKQERMYSEEDMLKSFMAGIKCESNNGQNFEQFIKQFKKQIIL